MAVRRGSLQGFWLWVLVGVPLVSWGLSQWRPILNGKTLLWLVPMFLAAVAVGAVLLRRVAAPLAVLLVAVQIAGCVQLFGERFDEAFPEVAELLRREARNGDRIFLDPPSSGILLSLYGWPRERLSVSGAMGRDPWLRQFDGQMVADLREAAAGRSRVWVPSRNLPIEAGTLAPAGNPGLHPVSDWWFGHGMPRNVPVRNLHLVLMQE